MKTRSPTNSLSKLAVSAIEDLKGVDVRVLDVRALTTITDTMIICSGTSSRHVKSIAEYVVEKVKGKGANPRGVQGLEQGEWVVVDLGGVVVHVMQLGTRAFYQLEKLWDIQDQPKPAVAAGR
jgi:ribosome-associated protein